LILDHYEVCLLIDVIDNFEDYYYKVIKNFSFETLVSCVGRVIPLKGSISDEDYNYLVTVWNNNSKQKAI